MKKKIYYTLFILLTIIAIGSYSIIKYPYSKGMRTGKLVKLSKKGFLFKTYEGVMDLGSGDQLTWNFSIRDKEIGEKLLNKVGKTIQLNYVEHLYKLFFNTKYNIISWKIMNQNSDADMEYFCRLVEVLRNNKELVEKARPLIKKYDEELLKNIRDCQN